MKREILLERIDKLKQVMPCILNITNQITFHMKFPQPCNEYSNEWSIFTGLESEWMLTIMSRSLDVLEHDCYGVSYSLPMNVLY